MDLFITDRSRSLDTTPVITLDKDTSVIITDSMGRQTIVSLEAPLRQTVLSPMVVNNLPPLISQTYEYQDINQDPELHQKVMKKIYTNFYNFIIPSQFPYLLNYIKKSKDGYSMVKTVKEYKKNKTKENEYENKLQYLARNVYSKLDMYKDINQYLDTYDIKWYEIEDKKKEIYQLITNKLKNRLENLLK